MSMRYSQGIYTVLHPEKYIGQIRPRYRSSWELVVFKFCDNHPSVLQWASESLKVGYRNPLTGKNATYTPDIFLIYIDKVGVKHAELLEIKPAAQSSLQEAKSRKDKLSVALNMAKWSAARTFCSTKGITFRVITEADIFAFTGKKK